MLGLLLQLLLLTLALVRTSAKCAMTQTCVNPGNDPDFNECIPEAHREPVDPQPMVGPQWANVTGGGTCATDADCSDKGACVRGACECRDEGIIAGAHCELFALQCPEYQAAACCSWQQNQGMAENFKLVASVFGKNAGGGCDACAANVLSLWCGLTCSPHQHEFLKMRLPFPSTSYRPDPMTGEERVKVLELDVALDKAFTCRLYDSCKNTAIASISEAMKSSLGFLNYQVQTGAIGHGQFMNLSFVDSSGLATATRTTDPPPAAFNHSVLQCANYSDVQGVEHLLPTQAQLLPSIASKTAPKQCPCGACRATCDAHRGGGGSDSITVVSDPISLFDGFNGGLVALVYGGVVAAALLLRWRKQH